MKQTNGNRLPRELERLGAQLRSERPEASPLDLDRIKTRAIRQAASAPMKGRLMRSRLVSILVAGGILLGGAGGVMAATGGIPGGNPSGDSSAAKSQYCPPSSPGAGKPKHGDDGSKCGKH